MAVICPPERQPWSGPTVFLAGSIEMGKATRWQDEVVAVLAERAPQVLCFNPRRANWDSTWAQDPDQGPFAEQVHWEMDHLEQADHVLFVFDPQTQSPITLLELGWCLGKRAKNMRVVCPKAFWRHGNVVIACRRHGVTVVETLHEALDDLLLTLKAQ